MKKLTLMFLVATMASACTWVKVDDGAENIVVGKESNVRGCERLSEVNVKVGDRLGPVHRNSEKVANELETMGKNEAVRLEGDTIVPVEEPEDGRQSFMVYRCQ